MSAKSQKKTLRKWTSKQKREIVPKLTENGRQRVRQKGIEKSMIFWLVFRTPLETSTELRRSFDGTSAVTLAPADPPGRRHIIKDYCTIISKDGWLAGSNTPRAVGPANLSL